MTILGQHTVAETRDLIRALEFRINQNMNQLQKLQTFRRQPQTTEQTELDADSAIFLKRWTNARDKETLLMTSVMLVNPKVSPIIMPAESNFQAIEKASRFDRPNLNEIQNRINNEAITQNLPPIDLSQIPKQNSPDADFAALHELDKAIAEGEALAKKGKEQVKDAAKSNVGLLIGLAAVGVVGVVVATKVYL